MPKQTFLRLVEYEDEQEVGGVFEPDDIAIMTSAFDRILSDLKLVGRDDLATRMLAKLVIELVPIGCVSWVVGQYAPATHDRRD